MWYETLEYFIEPQKYAITMTSWKNLNFKDTDKHKYLFVE